MGRTFARRGNTAYYKKRFRLQGREGAVRHCLAKREGSTCNAVLKLRPQGGYVCIECHPTEKRLCLICRVQVWECCC